MSIAKRVIGLRLIEAVFVLIAGILMIGAAFPSAFLFCPQQSLPTTLKSIELTSDDIMKIRPAEMQRSRGIEKLEALLIAEHAVAVSA